MPAGHSKPDERDAEEPEGEPGYGRAFVKLGGNQVVSLFE
jgi:hypothetical protein